MKQIGAYMSSSSFVKATETKCCSDHGQYVSALIWSPQGDNWSGCPICITNRQAANIQEILVSNSRLSKQNRVNSILKRAAIPPAFENVSFENYVITEGENQQRVFNNCKYFAENFARAIEMNKHGFLVGKQGNGKTHLAVSIIKKVLSDGYSAVFTKMSEICNAIRASYKNNDTSELEIIDNFTDIDLLIIDECASKDTFKPFEVEKLFEIVNNRYECKRPTLVLSNELNELELKIGTRTMSRLQEGGFVQTFDWQDYRQKKGSGHADKN